MDTRTAARILDLADAPAARGGSRSRALVIFLLIALLAAHAARSAGCPDSAQAAAMSPAGAGSRARESDHMKQLMAIGVAAAMAGSATAQNAVQWRVEDGGNGHWYQLGVTSNPLTWGSAQAMCVARGGYLATILTESEDLFAFGLSKVPSAWNGNLGPWLGGRQIPDSGEPLGIWEWVTGESWDYVGPDETFPNNGGPPGTNENRLHYNYFIRRWNDIPESGNDGVRSYILEWSADCNADGIVDYGQILAGELADANHNNIPDCCENGTPCGCAGDTNNDRRVDGIDLATILTRWGQLGAKFPAADCNNDGAIDGTDLAIVLAGWGGCP